MNGRLWNLDKKQKRSWSLLVDFGFYSDVGIFCRFPLAVLGRMNALTTGVRIMILNVEFGVDFVGYRNFDLSIMSLVVLIRKWISFRKGGSDVLDGKVAGACEFIMFLTS